MKARTATFLRRNWMLVSLTAATLALLLWFGTRLVLDFLYFHDPNNVDVDLKGWMTPRFIVITYDLPRPFVAELLELQSERDRGRPLKLIAADLGLTMDELTQKVRAAADIHRAGQK